MLRSVSAAAGALLSFALAASGCAQTPAGAGAARTACGDASLALPASTVVGAVHGKPITYGELGDDVRRAEDKALRQYCDAVAQARRTALDNHVTEQLVAAEAKKAGVEEDAWIRAEVEKRVAEPADGDVQAFYDKQKAQMGDQLPPLEMVRPQVVAYLKREKSEAAIEEVVGGLMKAAAVERRLPDVRSPALPLENAAHTPSKGKADAKIRVVEFADFECPYCSRAADTMKALEQKYGDRVSFSYRHFPLRSIHPRAQRASEIAQCAGEQGKFWAVHDALYAHQDSLDEPNARKLAVDAGVDAGKLEECLGAGRGASQVELDLKKGEEVGIEGTPSFFINGRQFGGNPTVAGISQALDEELAR
jgi:protein-disulfide isomerase